MFSAEVGALMHDLGKPFNADELKSVMAKFDTSKDQVRQRMMGFVIQVMYAFCYCVVFCL